MTDCKHEKVQGWDIELTAEEDYVSLFSTCPDCKTLLSYNVRVEDIRKAEI